MSSNEPVESEMIAVTPAARIYLQALASYGLLEGEEGQQQLADPVREVLHALHHVLGGGSVSVEIQSDGTSSIVDELGTALREGTNTCGGRSFADTGVIC